MIKSIGLDLVEIARIKADVERYGDRFVQRILGPQELEIYGRRQDKEMFLSGRFAAKEAVVKGLGHYLTDRPPLCDIQILNDSTGQPRLSLPADVQQKMPQVQCILSITHEKKYAAAVAVFTEEI